MSDFVDQVMQRGPPRPNTLMQSKRAKKHSRQVSLARSPRVSNNHSQMPGFAEAAKKCLDGEAFEQFVENLNNQYEQRLYEPPYVT